MTSREEHARRLNAMAGVDENGGILPPTDEDLAAGIDRKPLPFWKNQLRTIGAQNTGEIGTQRHTLADTTTDEAAKDQ